MSRGGSFGGGRSSLGYLFESDEPPIPPPGSSKANESPKPSSDEGGKTKAETPPTKPISNNYHRAQGQNTGNFITDRPFTKVQSAPGGSSSLGYLFGDK